VQSTCSKCPAYRRTYSNRRIMQTNLNMIPCRLTYGTFMNILKSTNRDYSQALTKASDNIHLYISYLCGQWDVSGSCQNSTVESGLLNSLSIARPITLLVHLLDYHNRVGRRAVHWIFFIQRRANFLLRKNTKANPNGEVPGTNSLS